ncbi:hypothetical protein GJAV_G00274190 [Gymnothorax javanicus]|nr:hypothetical protein GJAV_G00274190 [Gymnothorax javanicus]
MLLGIGREIWNNILSLSFSNEEFTKEWRQLFTTDLDGKFEKETPLNQIEIYCSSIEQIDESYPHVAYSIEKCALQAVNYICQNKAEAEIFKKTKINWKFGKLVSAIIEKSWPRDAVGRYQEGEEAILLHMLTWTAAKEIFHLHGADEKLTDKLSKEAKQRIAAAISIFTGVTRKVLTGAIEIKLVNHILMHQSTFIELVKIDCLSRNEKCKDSSSMRRLLQWRNDEMKAVYHKRKLVDSLLSMLQKLQEHIEIYMDDLQERLKDNIEVMTLNQFMDVHQFGSISSDMTGVVTFYKLHPNVEEMAKVLSKLKDCFIFGMCWENQAKDVSRRDHLVDDDDADDEDGIQAPPRSQLVKTLPDIYCEIFQPSYSRYQKIYSDLKSGALTLEEVDNIFKVYRGKYEELQAELEIMSRSDQLEEQNWIQRRVEQIEQYHEIHLAVESALVMKKVKQMLCLQGDFQVLDRLLEFVNFKNEKLDRIDNNLTRVKKDMVDISEPCRLCLQELGERKNFVMWGKEALGGPWKSIHIDDLRKSKDIKSDIKALRVLTITQLFEEKVEEAVDIEDICPGEGEQEMEQSENTDGREAMLDTTALVRSCVQSAVGMLRDQGESGARGTRRVEILLTLLAESEELKAAFLAAFKRRLHSLLVTYDGKSFSSKNWVIHEASNIDVLQEGGTLRHALWKGVQAVVTPLMAQLVSVVDRDYNLDLLLDDNSGGPVRKLWLDIFKDEKLLEIPFFVANRNAESKTIQVQSYITPHLGVGCSMPFSWRVRDFLEELWVHAQQHEGHTLRQFEKFFWNTPLGRYITETDDEAQREFFHRYLQDFVSMTMKVTSVEELQLLCTAMTCCINELRIRHDLVGNDVVSLPWIHAAHQEFKIRLQNLSRMVAIEPKVAIALQRTESSREGPEMVLDVFAALACVEQLEPEGWTRTSCSSYGQRSQEWARTVRYGWSRIFSLSLFVEHMLVGIEGLDQRLCPLLLEHASGLGRVLETRPDLKMAAPFLAVIDILRACKDGANDSIFKFGSQHHPICMGDPHDPLGLPCDHIYCLAYIRQWLVPGQMCCPLCKQEVPDDNSLTVSEDLRFRIHLNAQFRKRINAFFIDLVSTVCFKDNAPPCSEVIRHLLSFLMVSVEPVHIIRDRNPIVRSVILKLLLKYSFAEVRGFLQQHLTEVEQGNILDVGDKNELYSLYINCLEDSMLERTQFHTAAERTAFLQDERNFLEHFLHSSSSMALKISIDHLQQIARVRLCLDVTAHLLVERLTSAESFDRARNGVLAFLEKVAELCVRSRNDWYRVYLIRKICSQQGIEFLQGLLTVAEVKWLFPFEVLQDQGSGQMDHFLVWGEDYRAVHEAVTKATMRGGTEGIEEACERCSGTPAKKAVLLLLALFREVTTLYRAANPSLHPKPELLRALGDFIQASGLLVVPEARAFALALVHNQLGPLSVGARRPAAEHALVELTVHLAAVLICMTQAKLTPLRLLALSPGRMQAAFLPTMPDDMLAVARETLGPQGLRWYYCRNGHPCTVGECGMPMEVARCLDCGAEIGGNQSRPVAGFSLANIQGDRTQRGHVLGDPIRRDLPDMQDTKSMSPAPFTVVRLLTHMSMLFGACEHPQVLVQIINPPVRDPSSFLFGHLQKDMEQLGRVLGKGADDTASAAHLTVRGLLNPDLPAQWPVPHYGVLSTKEQRNAWETKIASDIIVPQLKALERQLKDASTLIRTDSPVSSSPVMKVVFGDPRLILTTLPQNSLVHCGAVWSCRERASLRGLAHVLEQNDGRDTLPVLWRFLQKEPELRLVRSLPEILELQRDLVKRFQNSAELPSGTIREFVQSLRAASLKSWYETRIKIFLTTWNQLRQSLATKGELKIPAEFCQLDFDLDSDVQVLLPRRQGRGLCATALVSYLIALHNEQVHAVDRHTGEETSYVVSPADLSDLHVIRYELERDLLPLVLSNCQYSVERGQETLSEYNLPKIQQQVLNRFLQGKPLISMTGIPTLVSRHDRNYENIFKDVKQRVGQEPLTALTLAALAGDLPAYSDVCEALSVVEVALGFLAMTGEDPHMQLVSYLKDVLQMEDQTAPHILKVSPTHCTPITSTYCSHCLPSAPI